MKNYPISKDYLNTFFFHILRFALKIFVDTELYVFIFVFKFNPLKSVFINRFTKLSLIVPINPLIPVLGFFRQKILFS